MRPAEALQEIIEMVSLNDRYKRSKIPGEVINNLRGERKELISQLKSDDIAPDKIMDAHMWIEYKDNYLKEFKLEFDKKIGLA